MGKLYVLLALGLASALLPNSLQAEQCGDQVGGATCPGGLCCGGSGFCGNTTAHCDPAHPSPPSGGGAGGDLSYIITQDQFELLLQKRNDAFCDAANFYTYDAFITAAKAFDGFGTTGDLDTRKREIASFFAHSSHETSGWWEGAPDGPYTWGYCLKEDGVKLDYCVHSQRWPCAAGKQYYGRGPLKLYFNYNYGAAGEAIGVDLLNNPELVVADPVIAFKTAIWLWMTPESPKPSCHDAITGGWTPSAADQAAGRVPGFGVTTNILNGAWECGHGFSDADKDREGFYTTYCPILGISPGMNIDCDYQLPFGWTDRPHLPK